MKIRFVGLERWSQRGLCDTEKIEHVVLSLSLRLYHIFFWQYCLAVFTSFEISTSSSSCTPGTWRPCCEGCPPSRSGWPGGRTCSWSGWWRARRRTCWRSSGTCPWHRCTRWTGWLGSPGGKNRARKGTGHHLRLQPLCAGKEISQKSGLLPS